MTMPTAREQKAKRLALTVSGAVSLGSYEAGVLYEVVTALAAHNRHATRASERIEIDVLTGASAGGMSVAVLAQKLLYDGSSFRGPEDNPLHAPWVQDIDLDNLLAMDPRDNARDAVLSSSAVDDISRRYLTKRYETPQQTRQMHLASASTLKLGLAMANLNGVDYTVPTKGSSVFAYTRVE